MNQHRRCLSCYQQLDEGWYHPACAKKIFGKPHAPLLETTQEEVEHFAKIFLSQKLAVTGVQRKLSVQIDANDHTRFTILSAMGGGYILKPPSLEFPQLPEIEDLCMHLASCYGITVASHSLIRMGDGHLAYITKRFDRHDHKKIPVEDMCQLSEFHTEQKYRSSHEKIGKIIRQYSSNPGDDQLRFFEIVLFSFLIGNSDMHLKNFSLWREAKTGFIRLTPAYDLLSTRLLLSEQEDPEELALTLNGRKSRLKAQDFVALGQHLGIPAKVIKRSINHMATQHPPCDDLICRSFLSPDMQERLRELMNERRQRLQVEISN